MSSGEEEEATAAAASGVLVKDMSDEMTPSEEAVMEEEARLKCETTQTHMARRAEMSIEDEEQSKTENEKPVIDASKMIREEEADEGIIRFENGESYIELKTHDYYHTLPEDVTTYYRDEGVTRFGNGESYIELKTHDYYHTLQEDVATHYKDAVFGGEHETLLRPKPFREMSVIEEEGEEGAEESFSKGVVEFADELASRILGEVYLEVGRAWDKVTGAWEEMTFSEFVQRREGKQHRQLYKTMSMVGTKSFTLRNLYFL
ncbi:hypothetical protein E2C01_019058 [Portunus trituberculatus]|uniref:Uncharacterized protein n=1 Tax=Portunus trituberculatus TaxID=210409 RepID=A0A5B7DY82_PORTR|nr:hypothetical protein [Portunus trituberculatus]